MSDIETIREALLKFSADAVARHAGTDGDYGRRESALAALDRLAASQAREEELTDTLANISMERDMANSEIERLVAQVAGLNELMTLRSNAETITNAEIERLRTALDAVAITPEDSYGVTVAEDRKEQA